MKTETQVQSQPVGEPQVMQSEIGGPTPEQKVAGYLYRAEVDYSIAAKGFAELARLLAVVLIEWEGEDKSASYYCRPFPHDLMNVVSVMESGLDEAETLLGVAMSAARHRLFAAMKPNPELVKGEGVARALRSIVHLNNDQVKAIEVLLAALDSEHPLHQNLALALTQAEQARSQMRKAAMLCLDREGEAIA
jgi:hypothetical protein